MPLGGVPGPEVVVPPTMLDVVGEPLTLVWRNEVGGLTGRVDGRNPRYVKWNPAGSGESLADEAVRLRWLAGRHPAPRLLDLIVLDDAELLVTAAVDGRSAVDEHWVGRPEVAIAAIAAGLRALHSLPIADCPFEWSVTSRTEAAEAAGLVVPEALRTAPEIDRPVVCHGDPCAPNTLIKASGEFAATVDVARLGVADRWADLAVATMSFGWNYESYNEDLFWETYGVAPDPERIDYYRALWNAT